MITDTNSLTLKNKPENETFAKIYDKKIALLKSS